MLDMLQYIEPNSIDSVVTDPPYELNFMGNGWDNSGIAFQKETWEKCLEVLKPGGYLLAFGGSRTFHRIAVAIEDAGFEIRDTIMWLYGSSMPKSMNIGLAIDKKNGDESEIVGYNGTMPSFVDVGEKQYAIVGVASKLGFGIIGNCDRKPQPIYNVKNQWKDWGTTLKPAFEPIIVARKPIESTVVNNIEKWGVGGINIGGCRIPLEDDYKQKTTSMQSQSDGNVFNTDNCGFDSTKNTAASANPDGRFPANVILSYDEQDFDEVCGDMPVGGKNGSINKRYEMHNMVHGDYGKCNTWQAYNDSGSASRYFYNAKASVRDREEGLEDYIPKYNLGDIELGRSIARKNTHVSVKPTSLMQYLVRLVTPPNCTILDPFNGSGSTGKAVMYENHDRNSNYKYIGIDLSEEYLEISKYRINFVLGTPSEMESVEEVGQSKSKNKKSLWE